MQKRKNAIYLFCFIVIGIMILFFLFFPLRQKSADTYASYNRNFIDKIKEEDTLVQKFKVEKDYQEIGLPIGLYDTIFEEGKIIVRIAEEGKKIQTKEIELKNVLDNEYYYIKYPFHKNKKYTMTIKTKNTKSPITFYTTEAKIKNASLTINGEKQTNCIQLSFFFEKNNYFSIWYCFLILSVVACFAVFDQNRKGGYHEK